HEGAPAACLVRAGALFCAPAACVSAFDVDRASLATWSLAAGRRPNGSLARFGHEPAPARPDSIALSARAAANLKPSDPTPLHAVSPWHSPASRPLLTLVAIVC